MLLCNIVVFIQFKGYVLNYNNVSFAAICSFRLDFEQFSTRGPTNSEENPATNAFYCRDVLKISSTAVRSLYYYDSTTMIL